MVSYTEEIRSFFACEQKILNFLNKDLVTKYFLVVLACHVFIVSGYNTITC